MLFGKRSSRGTKAMGHGSKIPTIKASENPMRCISKIVKKRKINLSLPIKVIELEKVSKFIENLQDELSLINWEISEDFVALVNTFDMYWSKLLNELKCQRRF